MIFTEEHARQVLDGTKRQTRRPVKPDESFIGLGKWSIEAVVKMSALKEEILGDMTYTTRDMKRLKWQVGKTYAVQPGRGKKAIGRIRLKAIRRERLQDISYADAVAEGCDVTRGVFLRDGTSAIDHKAKFREIWDSLYPNGPYTWKKDPDVWVLEFEPVKEQG